MRSRGSVRRAAAATAAALALAAVLTSGGAAPPGAAGATDTRTYTVWHWNVSGHKLNKGRVDTGMVTAALDSIKDPEQSPDFVSFNELCRSQYEEIRDRLKDTPSAWTGATGHALWSETHPAGTGICQGEAFGNALFSKAELRGEQNHLLPADYTRAEVDGGAYHEDRSLLCSSLAGRTRMKFCTTHITTSNRRLPDANSAKINTQQLGAVRDILKGFAAAGETYLVAGDFNAEPDMSRMGSLMATHTELDSTDARCPGYGEWTAVDNPEINDPDTRTAPCAANGGNPKIDLILAPTDRLVGPAAGPAAGFTAGTKPIPTTCSLDGGTTHQPCSDHRILIGTATLEVDLPVTPPAGT